MMYEIMCCYYDSFYCLYFSYQIEILRICSNFFNFLMNYLFSKFFHNLNYVLKKNNFIEIYL